MTAFYNDNDAYVCQWMTNLIGVGLIPPGTVDNRSIKEITPDDLTGFRQIHMFAGIGTWAYALRLAGWPEDREVWSGSVPCQPFSSTGKRGGTDDPRHLWPEWFRLIRECHPPVIFGEQVASKDGLAWLDAICADLEGAGYAVAAVDLCAAGAKAPHIRQRLYFVAHTNGNNGVVERRRIVMERALLSKARWEEKSDGSTTSGNASVLGDSRQSGLAGWIGERRDDEPQQPPTERAGITLGDADREQCDGRRRPGTGRRGEPSNDGFWTDVEWLPCRDGYYRPTKPGLFPLAARTPNRVAKLRAIGNSIVAPLAAEFIRAYMEVS